MSWASRRRTIYLSGVILFFVIVIGGPIAYWYFSIPATCTDGKQDGDETGVDIGGSCPVLDARYLQPHAVLWARAFRVRDGSYNAAAYVENPNQNAAVVSAPYEFRLYDAQNILVAQRDGTMYIMPGAITPVFEGAIDTGNRIVAHAFFEFTAPLVWQRMKNASTVLGISDKQPANVSTAPQITASVANSSVADLSDVSFVAVVFDPAGNAFAASATRLQRIPAGASAQIVFTWPDPFATQVGRVDIIPLLPPVPVPASAPAQ
jgi:hypothetical protein